MSSAIYAPRVNNNDDQVEVVEIAVKVGEQVKAGQILAVVETDKSAIDVEAEDDGFILKINFSQGEQVTVGSVLMWTGETADEALPESATQSELVKKNLSEPTAKAKALLKQHDLDQDLVPVSGNRMTVDDIELYLAGNGPQESDEPVPNRGRSGFALPLTAGKEITLNAEQQGMLKTVLWHRDQAVAGYIELLYETESWESYAKAYADDNGLILSPLLGLMAHRLVQVTAEKPIVNSTIVDNANGKSRLYQYDHVNLGFTVQAESVLYLTVLREAETFAAADFLNQLGELQRNASKHKLKPDQLQGASVSFSSIARWQFNRHIPVLPPYSSLIIAHAAESNGWAALGASYDHRVLNGFEVGQILRNLSTPAVI